MNNYIGFMRKTSFVAVIIAMIAVFLIMILGVIDVVGTKFFNSPLPGMKETVEELLVASVFLAFAFTELERGHVRTNIILGRLPPRWRFNFNIFTDIIKIFVLGLLCWRIFIFLQRTIDIGIYKQGEIHIPLWPSALVLFFSVSLFLIVLLILFFQHLLKSTRGE